MKITKLTLSLLAGLCTTLPPASLVLAADLPNCFNSNYDKDRGLFTLTKVAGNQANQQCLLTVGSRADTPASRLAAGRYSVSLSNGGGGGAGGTLQGSAKGGGGGGGGAGAVEQQATLNLTEGVYKLTIGAGGPGGSACVPSEKFGGGPGWLGSPSNIVRVTSAAVLLGAPGADKYARPTRARNERTSGIADGHGGAGPGQTTGGSGGSETEKGVKSPATAGASILASGRVGVGGAAGTDTADKSRSGDGGGGGASRIGVGGSGGGETTSTVIASSGKLGTSKAIAIAPSQGALGSGGGGGEGSSSACTAGAAGGHGFISFRPI